MAPVAKVKACFPCSSGKRKCDKAQPACTRCNDRDVECRYPPTKRKRPHASAAVVSNSPSISNSNQGPTTLTNIAFPSSAIDQVDPQEWLRSLGTLGAPRDDSSSSSSSTGHRDTTHFFLKPDTWIIRHIPFTTPTFSNEICMNYVRGIHDFFNEWVTNSHSSFMHRQLYADSGYPAAIQDAYTCIALHNIKNAANEDAIDDILAAKMAVLLKSYPQNDTSSENLDIREHLSRTQALYVHLVLSLFSSSIGARANGEQHIQTLISWTQQLWEVAHHDPDICQSENNDGSATSANAIVLDAMFDGDTTPRLWRSWVLSESIRRIWLMATSTIGVYLTLRQKWAECHGGIYFTSRKDVWNAKSASGWAAACRKADPLFVCSLECESLFLTSKASDVDDMLINMFTIMWGAERVENWVERTAQPGQVVKVWRCHDASEK